MRFLALLGGLALAIAGVFAHSQPLFSILAIVAGIALFMFGLLAPSSSRSHYSSSRPYTTPPRPAPRPSPTLTKRPTGGSPSSPSTPGTRRDGGSNSDDNTGLIVGGIIGATILSNTDSPNTGGGDTGGGGGGDTGGGGGGSSCGGGGGSSCGGGGGGCGGGGGM